MQTVKFLAQEALNAFTELVHKNEKVLYKETDETSAILNQELITRTGTILQVIAITGGKENYEYSEIAIQN